MEHPVQGKADVNCTCRTDSFVHLPYCACYVEHESDHQKARYARSSAPGVADRIILEDARRESEIAAEQLRANLLNYERRTIPGIASVDEKISDIIRMAVATASIVLESNGVDSSQVSRMKERTLRMLGVKERRA